MSSLAPLLPSPETQRGNRRRWREFWSGGGGQGSVVAMLHQGTAVAVLDGGGGKWVRVRTAEPFAIEGEVRASDLGCRLTSELPLRTSPDASQTDGVALGMRGCMVSVLDSKEGWLRVETAPEPFTWYEAGPGEGDPVVSHTVHGGYVVEGWVPTDRCSASEKPFYPKSPKDGSLVMIGGDGTRLNGAPGGTASQLPGKALPWTRWVATGTDGPWSHGRTDGQVVVWGWVQTSVLAPLPNTNPLNKLAERKVKDHEVVGPSPVEDGDGAEIVLLPVGTEVLLLAEDSRGCKVRSLPPIEVEGWMPCDDLRDVSTMPEAAIDYGLLDGGAPPPERGPIPNPTPWP